MFKHLRVALRLIAVSLILCSFIWGVDKVVSSSEKSEVPVLSAASDGKIVPVTVLSVDEPTDVGPTFADRVPTATTTPSDSTPMIVHWSESISGEFGGVRCNNMQEAWALMHSIAEMNLLDCNHNFTVWAEKELAPVAKVDHSLTSDMTRSHLIRVRDLSRHMRYIADKTGARGDDELVKNAIEVSQVLDSEGAILVANLWDEYAMDKGRCRQILEEEVGPAWVELWESTEYMRHVVETRPASAKPTESPLPYLLH